jgi:hypothetical protein
MPRRGRSGDKLWCDEDCLAANIVRLRSEANGKTITLVCGERAPDEIRVVEATYGLSCVGVSVPPPAQNLVRIGNVSDAVA